MLKKRVYFDIEQTLIFFFNSKNLLTVSRCEDAWEVPRFDGWYNSLGCPKRGAVGKSLKAAAAAARLLCAPLHADAVTVLLQDLTLCASCPRITGTEFISPSRNHCCPMPEPWAVCSPRGPRDCPPLATKPCSLCFLVNIYNVRHLPLN